MRCSRDTKGFTLIELLIVVAIIAILSLGAMRGYSQYRRLALLDLSSDNLVAQINELKDKAIHGAFGSERFERILGELEEGVVEDENGGTQAKCFGFLFDPAEEGYKLRRFEQDYSGKRLWDDFNREWTFTGCVNFNERSEMDFEIDESVFLLSDEDLSKYAVRYLPPNGDIEISMDGGLSFADAGGDEDYEFSFLLRYGSSDEDVYKRRLYFNPKTGSIKVGSL